MLVPGTHVGRYEILGHIGSGGMGEVYSARDTRLGRDVALKTLTQNRVSDPSCLDRFSREARAVAALNHPHIVTLYSTEEAEGVHFLTMELVRGRRLDEIITPPGLDWRTFFRVATALAGALAAAHEKDIVHRDLKPANIMLSDEGRVKVLDFGLARFTAPRSDVIGDSTKSLGVSSEGFIVGTMPYMSPEQIEGRPLDHRTDLFSFGIVLFEMSTGQRPFRGDSGPALMSSILKDPPLNLSQCRPDVPAGVARLIEWCLEKSVNRRLASARDVQRLLEAESEAVASGATRIAVTPQVDTTRMFGDPGSSAAQVGSADGMWVAVLPFVARNSNSDAEAFAQALTEDVTSGLSSFPFLRVVAQMDSERAASLSADTRAVGKVLGARYLFGGTVRTANDRIRVGVRLVDSGTGGQMWSDTFEQSLTGSSLFAVQDEITRRIVGTVADHSGVLVRALSLALAECRCEDLTLGELVLRYYMYLHHLKAEEHARLRTAFERALEQKPAHARGWACLAELYEHEYSFEMNPLPDSRARARRAAERAVELDPLCQDGWIELTAASFFARDKPGYRAAAERALAVNPLDVLALSYVGLILAFGGEWERGLGMVQQAMALNPHHAGWLHFVPFYYHFRLREYEDALVHVKRVNMPWLHWMHLTTASVAGQLGQAADAEAALSDLARTTPSYLDLTRARLGWALWLWDDELVDRLTDGLRKAIVLSALPKSSTADTDLPGNVRIT